MLAITPAQFTQLLAWQDHALKAGGLPQGYQFGLGDLNGDGTTGQRMGNPIAVTRPAVTLTAGSHQAGVEGSTTQAVRSIATSDDSGQVTPASGWPAAGRVAIHPGNFPPREAKPAVERGRSVGQPQTLPISDPVPRAATDSRGVTRSTTGAEAAHTHELFPSGRDLAASRLPTTPAIGPRFSPFWIQGS